MDVLMHKKLCDKSNLYVSYYVYIMTNKSNSVLYIGVTDNLGERVKEHKLKVYPNSFTSRYNCNKLVYFEEFENGSDASLREKRFKKWNRAWKIDLIEEMNPNWSDLTDNWNLDLSNSRLSK